MDIGIFDILSNSLSESLAIRGKMSYLGGSHTDVAHWHCYLNL